jgi:hypothetical protein
MQDWKTIFEEAGNSGIYHAGASVDETELRKLAAVHGFQFALMDLRNVSDKAGLLGEVSRVLQFPPYFGMNWDALSDCLADLSWKPAAGYVLLFAGLSMLQEKAAVDVTVAVRILHAAADFWRQKGVPFYVVLCD